jgi:hypothetical protein
MVLDPNKTAHDKPRAMIDCERLLGSVGGTTEMRKRNKEHERDLGSDLVY